MHTCRKEIFRVSRVRMPLETPYTTTDSDIMERTLEIARVPDKDILVVGPSSQTMF